MSTARRLRYTYEDYLDALKDSGIRLEYWQGELLAMAAGTPEHAALAAQITVLLGARLPSSDTLLNSDAMIRVVENDVTLFADASVVCGKLERARDDKLAIVNPRLIVEVTSESTEAYDRGAKLDQYKQLKALRAVWIVSHSSKRVTVVERHGRSWRSSERGEGELLTLDDPALSVDVDAIYAALDRL